MLAIVSPAKSLDYESDIPEFSPTESRFPVQTKRLATGLRNLTKTRLKEIMPVSDNLIELNRGRYADFFAQEERPAIFAYSGDVYRGFEARTLDDEAINFAQNHLRILSGLYGLLRPLDAIRPHRLEMGTKWAPRQKKLTDFWKDQIANTLSEDLEAQGDRIIVNLASQEYWASVAPYADKLDARIVTCEFKQDAPEGPKFISFEAKRARGMMARFICENHLSDPEALKAFGSDGYQYSPEYSDDDNYMFLRQ